MMGGASSNPEQTGDIIRGTRVKIRTHEKNILELAEVIQTSPEKEQAIFIFSSLYTCGGSRSFYPRVSIICTPFVCMARVRLHRGPFCKRNANCGVTREGDFVKITYKVGKGSKVTCEPIRKESGFILTMRAKERGGGYRGHDSNVIPEDEYRQLGKPTGESREDYYIVKMRCPRNVDIEKYFN